jgi:hypothetical protein
MFMMPLFAAQVRGTSRRGAWSNGPARRHFATDKIGWICRISGFLDNRPHTPAAIMKSVYRPRLHLRLRRRGCRRGRSIKLSIAQALRRPMLLSQTQKRKDHTDDHNQTDQINDSVHHTPPFASVTNANAASIDRFRDSRLTRRALNRPLSFSDHATFARLFGCIDSGGTGKPAVAC